MSGDFFRPALRGGPSERKNFIFPLIPLLHSYIAYNIDFKR